jgi:uncharacterized protein with PQ loop repeat
MIEVFGWLSSLMFGFCGLPQAYKSYKDGNSDGISWMFAIMWFLGEIFAIIYVLPMKDGPLLVNYGINLLFLCIILWYKFFPRK